jgi:photosystem II stability/assembly factor-like uncharacterized protein
MNHSTIRRSLTIAVNMMVFLCLFFESSFGGIQPRTGRHSGDPRDKMIPGVVIVKLRSAAGLGKVAAPEALSVAHLQKAGALRISRIFPGSTTGRAKVDAAFENSGLDRMYSVSISPLDDPRTAALRFEELKEVEYAVPKYAHTLLDVPNDSLFTLRQAAYFAQMHVTDAWTVVKGDSVIVADVDGGTYWRHPDITPNLWINKPEDANADGQFEPTPYPGGDDNSIDDDGDGFVDDVIGWNFANSSNDPQGLAATPGSAAHGTATASMVGAATNNTIGMAGTAWNCRLMVINASSPTVDEQIDFGFEGIAFAAAHGAKVINCSWGRTGSFSPFEQDVVTAASNAGALVVVAAGNGPGNNDAIPNYPANYSGALAVGATNSGSDTKASFSNYGVSVPVFAPGVNIWGALTNGKYSGSNQGTSFSTPMAAGLAALLFSLHPSWSPLQVAVQMRVTSDLIDGTNPTFAGHLGHGRLNFANAVTAAVPGLEIVSVTTTPTNGHSYFSTGDTATVSITIQNVLPQAAQNAQFQLTSSNASVAVLAGTANVTTIASLQQVALPTLLIVADSVTNFKNVPLTIRWQADGGYTDAASLSVTVYSGAPSWNVMSTPATGVASLYTIKAVNTSTVWAAGNTPATAPIVVRTANGGTNWTDVTGNLPSVGLYCIDAVDSSRAWVGTGDGRIFATVNGGASWSVQSYSARLSPFIDGIKFFDTQNGVAMGDPPGSGDDRFIVLLTTNGGTTWNHSAGEPLGTTGAAGWSNSFSWTDASHGWFGSNANAAWRTTDGGSSWASSPTGSKNSIGISFGTQLQGVVAHDDGSVSVSSDGGATWTPKNQPASLLTGTSFVPASTSVWATSDVIPYYSTDGGASWQAKSTFPFIGGINAVDAVDSLHVWAATSFGEILALFSLNINGITGNGARLPAAYVLSQNYPNPFNPQTRIIYTLPHAGNVLIDVYDLLGRRVQVLVDGVQSAGQHTVLFDGTRQASGVYFYRMRTDVSTQVRKMILLR